MSYSATPASPGAQGVESLGFRKSLPFPELLNVSQVAVMLGLGKSSIWRHVKNGSLPKPISIGGSTRWRRADIEAVVNQEAA